MTTKTKVAKTEADRAVNVGQEAHAKLVHHFIASHGRAGRSFFEVYAWGATLADSKISELGFADRPQFELWRRLSLMLEGSPPAPCAVVPRSDREM